MIEAGSELAAELWKTAHPAASSILAYPEGRAALAAAQRSGRLSTNEHALALEDFESIHAELHSVGIDEPLSRHAGGLAEDFELRGFDAVHLASGLALGGNTTFVTWDKHLARAAKRCGCAVAPVL